MLWTALHPCGSLAPANEEESRGSGSHDRVGYAKSVSQLHGVDAAGTVVLRRQLRRSQLLVVFSKAPACLVGMEACASSHHWARELMALHHEVKLMRRST